MCATPAIPKKKPSHDMWSGSKPHVNELCDKCVRVIDDKETGTYACGVAMVGRIDKIKGLFCKRAL